MSKLYFLRPFFWLEKKKYDKVLSLIRLSREWPENLGVGKPYDPDERIQDYVEAFALEQQEKQRKQTPCVRKWLIIRSRYTMAVR